MAEAISNTSPLFYLNRIGARLAATPVLGRLDFQRRH